MFSHEALLYEGPDGLLAGSLPFIYEGLERDESILVAVSAPAPKTMSGAGGRATSRKALKLPAPAS